LQYYVVVAYCYRWSSVVCLSVHRSVTIVSPAKLAEPIEMPFGMWTQVGPRNHVLLGVAHWHKLANTTDLSMCCSDAALCESTSTIYWNFPSLLIGRFPGDAGFASCSSVLWLHLSCKGTY